MVGSPPPASRTELVPARDFAVASNDRQFPTSQRSLTVLPAADGNEASELRRAIQAHAYGREDLPRFGVLCCQVLQIPAAAFQPYSYTSPASGAPAPWSVESHGYLRATGPGSVGDGFLATVRLPEGARIAYVGMYYRDSDANGWLEAIVRRHTSDGLASELAVTSSVGQGGYGYSFTPFGHTVSHSDGAFYSVRVTPVATVSSPTLAFRGVDVWWQQQISEPLVETFTDVPVSHPYYAYIEALAASGITSGCSLDGTLYCPESPVSRGQMAMFIARALGLHFVP